MISTTPLTLYQEMLKDKNYQHDIFQEMIIIKMNSIHQKFTMLQRKCIDCRKINVFYSFFKKFFLSTDFNSIKGLYIWGSTGTGKTMLMDLFYHSLPGKRKLRLHFYKFMDRLHQEIFSSRDSHDSLELIADKFKLDIDLFCFDEFFISDIADAMLLGNFIKKLFIRNIILVITSNVAPDDLYFDGFHRDRFLPIIKLIKNYCDVVCLGTSCDYRMLSSINQRDMWLSPIGDDIDQKVIDIFNLLSGQSFSMAKKGVMLEINHRLLPTLAIFNDIVLLDFSELFKSFWDYRDYIVLAKKFHSIFLLNVQQMRNNDEDVARRFMSFIDELYDCRVKLVVSASISMLDVYHGDLLKFEYQRCLSRLCEMQGKEYLNLLHRS